jgi:hypothetical protein
VGRGDDNKIKVEINNVETSDRASDETRDSNGIKPHKAALLESNQLLGLSRSLQAPTPKEAASAPAPEHRPQEPQSRLSPFFEENQLEVLRLSPEEGSKERRPP